MATVSEAYLTLGSIAHLAIGTHHFAAISACVPVTAAKALKETFGCDGQRGSSPDVDLADVISLFGHNVAET